MVLDRGIPAQHLHTCTAVCREILLAARARMKPIDPVVVQIVEGFAKDLFDKEDKSHRFSFVLPNSKSRYFSYTFFAKGGVKTWITRSRRIFPDAWASAEAVVLSYRGKKTIRFNVVLKSGEAYSLDVSLKTGALVWKALDTKLANQLKEALKVAQR